MQTSMLIRFQTKQHICFFSIFIYVKTDKTWVFHWCQFKKTFICKHLSCPIEQCFLLVFQKKMMPKIESLKVLRDLRRWLGLKFYKSLKELIKSSYASKTTKIPIYFHKNEDTKICLSFEFLWPTPHHVTQWTVLQTCTLRVWNSQDRKKRLKILEVLTRKS